MRLLVSLQLACSLVSVSGLSAVASTAHRPPVLTIAVPYEPETYDWANAGRAGDALVLKNIMEGLFALDAKGRAEPRLAESFTLSADRRTYTFKLRAGVRWSDGRPLEAGDFVDAWKRLLEPLSLSPYVAFLFDIDGASEYHAGVLRDFGKTGVKAVDSRTLQVTLRRPCGYFPQLLTLWVTFPVRADLIKKFGAAWTQPEHLVVLGPFLLAAREKDKRVVLKRNPTYHGPAPRLAEARLLVLEEETAAEAAFRAKQADVFSPSGHLDTRRMFTEARLLVSPLPRTTYLRFDLADFPFNNREARLAFARALDRTKLSAALHGLGRPATSLLPPGVSPAAFTPPALPAFEPKAAKEQLRQAGFGAEHAPAISLVALAGEENAFLTSFLQDQFQKNLGVKIDVTLLTMAKFDQSFAVHDASIYVLSWTADYLDPQSFMAVFLSASKSNALDWKGEAALDYDSAVDRAAAAGESPERTALYGSALKILQSDEAIIVPLHHSDRLDLLHTWVKGFEPNALGEVDLSRITLE